MDVVRWTGRETKALRDAMRLTQRDFAYRIPVSDRMVRYWEAGDENAVPRPAKQAALDTLLARAGAEVQQRFAFLITQRAAEQADVRTEQLLSRRTEYQRHGTDQRPMVRVEEGIFLSGPEARPVWCDAFLIDVYPVTNKDYAKFVDSTGHPAPRHWLASGYPSSLADHPVVWVTWDDANDYARWVGKQLPTAAQWEKAARGAKGRTYPWGDAPTAAKCNVLESEINSTTPVDRYQSGASPYGAYDLCGNTWEWLDDESGPDRRQLRGSAFTSPFRRAAPHLRNDAHRAMLDNDTGFRTVFRLAG
ncbi:SUMF1/EgtB/PvdO family nonheme iron enzyme [Streptomyces sp. NPDC003660]